MELNFPASRAHCRSGWDRMLMARVNVAWRMGLGMARSLAERPLSTPHGAFPCHPTGAVNSLSHREASIVDQIMRLVLFSFC